MHQLKFLHVTPTSYFGPALDSRHVFPHQIFLFVLFRLILTTWPVTVRLMFRLQQHHLTCWGTSQDFRCCFNRHEVTPCFDYIITTCTLITYKVLYPSNVTTATSRPKVSVLQPDLIARNIMCRKHRDTQQHLTDKFNKTAASDTLECL